MPLRTRVRLIALPLAFTAVLAQVTITPAQADPSRTSATRTTLPVDHPNTTTTPGEAVTVLPPPGSSSAVRTRDTPRTAGTALQGAGDVLDAQTTEVFLAPGQRLKVPAKAWRMLYRSTSATGAAVPVSGTLIVPKLPYLGKRPILGYAAGTHGLGDQCAPSAQMGRGTDLELALISLALLRGWAVAVTDYEGLGTAGDHTYMVGLSQGRAVLDSIRAAARVPGAGLSATAPTLVMGYSQGGASAAWAAQLHPSYAPELRLLGVAAGGVPADLLRVARGLDGTADFGLTAAAGIGFNAAYPELALDSYLTAEGSRLFGDVRDDCLGDITRKLANRRLADLTTADVLDLPDWRARLAENRLGGTAPRVPMFLYHANSDEIIPFAVGSGLRRQYCAGGTKVFWTPLPVGNHTFGAVQGAPLAVEWLAHRVFGLPVLSNC
ncbi:lipase family protein [Rhizohabitans arisaemae]|uniref:lipase family protein n=1 Tax=Rhizohabitans arisaemae TaxID=2720610 RepID=UPI0024B22B53|nr:lipase family protein [Rhizohabitans arisaemae]